MLIYKIESDYERKIYGAKIELNYDELRDLSNILCDAEQLEEWSSRSSFIKLARNIHFLFDIVKNGTVDDWTFEHGNEMTQRMKELDKR